MRTARSRISGEKRFDFLFMAPSSQSLEPPQNPGRFNLARAIHTMLLCKPNVQVVLLKNHGVILGSETLTVIEIFSQVLNEKLRIQPREMNNFLIGNTGLSTAALNETCYQVCPDPKLHCLGKDPDLYSRLMDSWALCPDHVVFLGADAVCVHDPAELHNILRSVDYSSSPYIFVKDSGVLENRKATKAQRAQLNFYLDVMLRQPAGKPVITLSKYQVAELLSWDAEKYRLSLNKQLV